MMASHLPPSGAHIQKILGAVDASAGLLRASLDPKYFIEPGPTTIDH